MKKMICMNFYGVFMCKLNDTDFFVYINVLFIVYFLRNAHLLISNQQHVLILLIVQILFGIDYSMIQNTINLSTCYASIKG